MLSFILSLILLSILPFGELLRVQLNNGINLSALDVVAFCFFVYVFVQGVRNKRYLAIPLVKPILLFFGVGLLSLLANSTRFPSFDLFVGSLYLFRWIAYTCIYIVFFHIKKKQKQQILLFILLSGILFVLFGFIQYFYYPNLKNLFYAGWDEHYLRLFATFFDPNFAGIYLVLFFLFLLDMWFRFLEQKKRAYCILISGLLFLTCSAILLTYSRSSFIALFVGLCFFLFPKGYKKFLAILSVITVLFILFVTFLTGVPTEGAHLLRIPSSVARIDSLFHAMVIFSDNPLLGVGFDTYRYAQKQHGFLGLSTWETSHAASGSDNSLFFILATTGIIGFFTYAFLLYKIFRFLTQKTSPSTMLGVATLAAVLSGSLFINALFYAPLMAWVWMIFGFIESR